jgi:hypothetical protein
MGREHSWNKKGIVDDYQRVDLAQIKRAGVYSDMTISWGVNRESSIGLILDTEQMTARFRYRQLNKVEDTSEDFDYTIPLDSTPCHFGGFRYWFKCQAITPDGTICNRRVRALLNGGRYYVCRHCLNLSYQSKQETRSSIPEFQALRYLIKREQKMEKLLPIKKITHKGKYTKRYQKYLEYSKYC